MTGPEHYREAERLLTLAHRFTYGDENDPAVGAALAAEAQAHATLAQVAAYVAAQPGSSDENPWLQPSDATPWHKAIGMGGAANA